MRLLHLGPTTSAAILLFALVVSLNGAGPFAQSPESSASQRDSTVEQRCAALASTDFGSISGAPTRVASARMVDVPPPDPKALPGTATAVLAASPIKQYCQVLGYVAPQNRFELRLPLPSQWNQRFHLTACAGFCGAVNGNACNRSLARGYASITGNGGHDGGPGFDGVWAANSPNLQEDFAWRHNHVITLAGKAITTTFYGRPIARSYMSGCSKGGHAVLMEAQRFPEDFDGLLPSAPVYDLVGRIMAGAWWAQAVSDGERGSILNPTVADTVHKSVLVRCGAQAGVEEGLVTDPLSCDWKPDMIACSSTNGDSGCLTPRQVEAVKRMMSPVVNSQGQVIYGYPDILGTATEWGGWHYPSVNPAAPSAYANFVLHDQFLRFMADPTVRQGVDPLKFDFDRDPRSLARAMKLYNATSFDLRAFKARGGKMLMWHGLSDAAIIATSSMGYYEGVEKVMGGRAQTQDFFRLFLVPGVHHCAGGPGLTEFDALTLLENWVEKGQAPDVMVASRLANGITERTRPIFPYPRLARYSGSGDPKQASSYVAFDPVPR
jgi:Tannase and feruloyl esterase